MCEGEQARWSGCRGEIHTQQCRVRVYVRWGAGQALETVAASCLHMWVRMRSQVMSMRPETVRALSQCTSHGAVR